MDHAHVIPPSGGTPWNVGGDVVTCKADLELIEPHLQVFLVSGTRGAGLPPHRHPWDEIVVVLDGELEVRTGDEVHLIVRGAVAVAPAGAVHGVRTLTVTSRYLSITSSDRAAGFFADMHEHAADGLQNADLVEPIARRHGLELAPPGHVANTISTTTESRDQ